MKYLYLVSLLSLSLYADQVKVESLACPSMEVLREAQGIDLHEYMDLNLFAIKHSCKILNRSSEIQVINYDVNSRTKWVEIEEKTSTQHLFILRKNITIEQPGSNNTFKF